MGASPRYSAPLSFSTWSLYFLRGAPPTSQWALADFSCELQIGHCCRTSTASAKPQWALPDLNVWTLSHPYRELCSQLST